MGLEILEVFEPGDGGVAEHVRLVALGLHSRGHRVVVAGRPDAAPRAALEAAGIRYVALPLVGRVPAPGPDRAAARALDALLASSRFDVVHTHAQKAGILGRRAARRAGVPSLYTPNSLVYRTQLLRPRRGARLRFWLNREVERRLGRHTAAFVAVSEEERRAAIDDGLVPASRAHVIHNGVAPDPAVPADPALLAHRGAGPLFGFVAGMRDQKGLPTLLEALEALAARDALPPFAIVGSGPLEAEVGARVAGGALAGRVLVAPFAGRVEPYLRALDVFVLPSYWEGLPLAVLEAMTLGVPALATSVGGTPEAIRDDETGWLVAPHDAAGLADRIEAVAADRGAIERAGRAAAADAAARFGAGTMVDAIEALYRRLAPSAR